MISFSASVLNNPSFAVGLTLLYFGNSKYLFRNASSRADSSRYHVCIALRGSHVGYVRQSCSPRATCRKLRWPYLPPRLRAGCRFFSSCLCIGFVTDHYRTCGTCWPPECRPSCPSTNGSVLASAALF